MEIQARIPVSLAALHNFIRIHDPKEIPIIGSGSRNSTGDLDAEEDDHVAQIGREEVDERRDQIAEAMWADYKRICQERGMDFNDPFDGDVDEDSGDEQNSGQEDNDEEDIY